MTGNTVRFSVCTISAKAWRSRQKASCARICCSLPPMISNALVISLMDLSSPSSPPMGEPRRVACSGLTGQKAGKTRSIAVLVLWSLQMISDLK